MWSSRSPAALSILICQKTHLIVAPIQSRTLSVSAASVSTSDASSSTSEEGSRWPADARVHSSAEAQSRASPPRRRRPTRAHKPRVENVARRGTLPRCRRRMHQPEDAPAMGFTSLESTTSRPRAHDCQNACGQIAGPRPKTRGVQEILTGIAVCCRGSVIELVSNLGDNQCWRVLNTEQMVSWPNLRRLWPSAGRSIGRPLKHVGLSSESVIRSGRIKIYARGIKRFQKNSSTVLARSSVYMHLPL